ncbi:winged helix-turn-helix domain-containing protein [Kaistella sp.]|uniref:winged helix-turn-helix domain-containing protein n=1 Tax=Kaistella sp. TaxID=2782235 RepID=UPI003FA59E6D
MIEIPKFHETFIPILKVLENGETLNTRELYKLVIEKFYSELSKDQLEQQTKSGDTLIINRIAWGKSYLKKVVLLNFRSAEWYVLLEKAWLILINHSHCLMLRTQVVFSNSTMKKTTM